MEPSAHASSSRHGGALEKLKSVVTKCAMASAPSKSLSVQHTALIEKRIQELLPTPHHPPYAWMIENAIKELNLEGSCLDEEEAIAKFISQEYKGLHWAHSALLHHHFKKLSKTGDLITHHHNLTVTSSSSSSPVSSSTPPYASTDHSSASSQSFERTRTRKKKKKKTKRIFRNKSGKLKGARGMSNWDGEMMKMKQGQVGSDICLGGMGEVDIQSLLTEDETTNIQVPSQEQQQQIIVFGIEAHGINDQHRHSGDDSSTPTTFPSKARRIRNRLSKHRKKRRGRSRKMRESESNMINVVDTMEGETQVHVNGVEQDSMDELIEQVYGELTGTLCLTIDGEAAETGRNVQIHQTCDDINEQEQQQESRKLVEKQKHIKEDQFGYGICIEEQTRPKPRPRPYRNVADIYKASPALRRRSDGKSSRPL